MRKTLLTLAALALMASPVFAGKFNKTVSVGEKAPTFELATAVVGERSASSASDTYRAIRVYFSTWAVGSSLHPFD